MIIVVKFIVTIFLIGALLGSFVKFLPAFRNKDMNPIIDYFVAGLMVVSVLYGFYYTWM